MEIAEKSKKEKPPKHFVEKLKDSAVEATRNNLGRLKGLRFLEGRADEWDD
ncbi:hypothetical protein [Virgibacillus sp. Bac330]|nr:hypothetical protein [Virgibacillus sp. Bac330]